MKSLLAMVMLLTACGSSEAIIETSKSDDASPVYIPQPSLGDITGDLTGQSFTGDTSLEDKIGFPSYYVFPKATTVTFQDNDTIALTFDGVDYVLSRQPNTDQFETQSGDTQVGLQLFATPNADARQYSITFERADASNVIFDRDVAYGLIGLASDPATLNAIASASYSGTSNWGTSESGDLITSTGTPAHFDVNFTDKTLTGTVTLANSPSNTSQLISYPVTGAITGNSFLADVDVNARDFGVSAISAVTLNGGFFGANAETLAGFAHGIAGSPTRATNTFYLWVEAAKQ